MIGAGFCGRVLSLVLSRHFDRVVLLEKKAEAQTAWQGHHAHLLNGCGLALLHRLLPDLDWPEDESVAVDMDEHVHWQGPNGHRLSALHSGVGRLRFFRRERLDEWLRNRVAATTNIDWQFAVDDIAIESHAKVVRCRTQRVAADAVFITTGKHGAALSLLSALGVTGHPQRVPSQQRYRSFIVRGPLLLGKARSLVLSTWGTVRTRGMVIFGTAPDEYLVTQVAPCFDDSPRAFAEQLNCSEINTSLMHSEQVVKTALRGSERLSHRCLRSLPEDVFVMGDAAISMNPVFGQGMALSLLGIAAVEQQLQDGLLSSSRHAQQTKRSYRDAWWLGTAEDRLHAIRGWQRRWWLWGEQQLYARLAVLEHSAFHTAVFMQAVHMMKPLWTLALLWWPTRKRSR